MIRGSAKIDFERQPKFLTKSTKDLVLKPYSKEDILTFIGNILSVKAKGERKELLQRIVEDLEMIYSYSK